MNMKIRLIKVLIVPSGIETTDRGGTAHRPIGVLIVPSGIETYEAKYVSGGTTVY